MKAVILAAGKGTRLWPFTSVLPKPLLPIGKKKDGAFNTVIEHVIDQLSRVPVSEIIIVVNYLGDSIVSYLDQIKPRCKITYVRQTVLDGNGGAFYRAQSLLKGEDVIIVDCDNVINDNDVFTKMAELHNRTKASITVGVGKVEEITKFAIIKTDRKGRPVDIFEKPIDTKKWGNLAKSGVMILSESIASLPKKISKAPSGEYTTTQIIKHCIDSGEKVVLYGLSFNDIGTWPEYLPILKKALD